MFIKSEFELLSEVFRKRGISVMEIGSEGSPETIPEYSFLSRAFGMAVKTAEESGNGAKALYRFKDELGLRGIFFYRSFNKSSRKILIGPYFEEEKSERQLLEEIEEFDADAGLRPVLLKYLLSVPCVSPGSELFLLLNTFLERMNGGKSVRVVDIELESRGSLSGFEGMRAGEDIESSALHMKLIEKRYDFENELMRSVAAGHLQKVNALISSLTENRFEMRTSDPIRNMKNYCIIMNTLLRKSAENGGVHPVFIDKLSSDYAVRIEKLSSSKAGADLMRDMYESYCRMVRKHTVKDYSPVVQKAVSLIAVDLSADLAPGRIAEIVGVSLPYLSTIFKKETGRTLGAYIKEKRMKFACHLMKTSSLQVQSIALAVGIDDAQYFSKLFKSYTGLSPVDYRRKNADKD